MLQSLVILLITSGAVASTTVSTVGELSAAISDASLSHIMVSPGTYLLGSVSGSAAFQVWNPGDLTIEAVEPGSVVLDGQGQKRIFDISVSPHTATLIGLNMTGGSGEGAAVKHYGGEVRLIGCSLYDNDGGSAVYAYGSSAVSVRVSHSRFHGNSAWMGGAMRLMNGPVAVVEDSTLTHNSANYGGAVMSQGASLTLTRCDVSHNTASGDTGGGAIYHTFGSLTLTSTTLNYNAATHSSVRAALSHPIPGAPLARGPFLHPSDPVLTRAIPIHALYPQASGGAFKAHPADVTMTDCEVMHNTCVNCGKGAAFYAEQGTVRASRRVL